MRVLGVAGWSGSGKTTLIERLLPRLAEAGLRVSVIKHSHHDIALDAPGKDSHRHRMAGAAEVMVVSPYRWGVFAEVGEGAPPALEVQLARLAPVDLVLLEGQKGLDVPKIEVFRPSLGKPPRHPDDPWVIDVASDAALKSAVPCLSLDQPDAVAAFILAWLEKEQ